LEQHPLLLAAAAENTPWLITEMVVLVEAQERTSQVLGELVFLVRASPAGMQSALKTQAAEALRQSEVPQILALATAAPAALDQTPIQLGQAQLPLVFQGTTQAEAAVGITQAPVLAVLAAPAAAVTVEIDFQARAAMPTAPQVQQTQAAAAEEGMPLLAVLAS
jgi:hypothetical protein